MITAFIQENRALAAAAKMLKQQQVELSQLPPDGQLVIKFKDLFGRWPQKSEFWYIFWDSFCSSLLLDLFCKRLGHEYRLLARQEAWRAELQALIVDVDLALVVPGNALTHVLLRHHALLTGQISVLLRFTPAGEARRHVTVFGNHLQDLVSRQMLLSWPSGLV